MLIYAINFKLKDSFDKTFLLNKQKIEITKNKANMPIKI